MRVGVGISPSLFTSLVKFSRLTPSPSTEALELSLVIEVLEETELEESALLLF